jgi:phosphopantetheinyl transferase
VSFSRTSGYEVAAARVGDAIGLDVESVARVAAHPVDGVLLHPAERRALEGLDPDAADRYRAQLWVAKEAELKRRGTGLRSDPRELMMLPIARPGLTLFDLDADVVGALATS